MHRVVKALLEDRATVLAVKFDVQPEPDHRNIRPSDLLGLGASRLIGQAD
jgi:hypothetical protein